MLTLDHAISPAWWAIDAMPETPEPEALLDDVAEAIREAVPGLAWSAGIDPETSDDCAEIGGTEDGLAIVIVDGAAGYRLHLVIGTVDDYDPAVGTRWLATVGGTIEIRHRGGLLTFAVHGEGGPGTMARRVAEWLETARLFAAADPYRVAVWERFPGAWVDPEPVEPGCYWESGAGYFHAMRESGAWVLEWSLGMGSETERTAVGSLREAVALADRVSR